MYKKIFSKNYGLQLTETQMWQFDDCDELDIVLPQRAIRREVFEPLINKQQRVKFKQDHVKAVLLKRMYLGGSVFLGKEFAGMSDHEAITACKLNIKNLLRKYGRT